MSPKRNLTTVLLPETQLPKLNVIYDAYLISSYPRRNVKNSYSKRIYTIQSFMESFPDEAQNMLSLFSFMTLFCFFFYLFKLPKSSSQTKFLLTPSDKKINHRNTFRLSVISNSFSSFSLIYSSVCIHFIFSDVSRSIYFRICVAFCIVVLMEFSFWQ
jgi:hypothetical protein